MNVIIAGQDHLGIAMANKLSQDGHRVVIVEEEGLHLRSYTKHLVDRENVTLFEANPALDETMIATGIYKCDMFISALRSDAANGLAALKAKISYQVDKVVAFITDESLARVYPRFKIIVVNPHELALESLSESHLLSVGASDRPALNDSTVVS